MLNSQKKSSIKPILLMLIFILPMLASWFLFHYHHFFQLKTTNHGILFQPSLSVPELTLGNPSEKTWKIVYIAPAQSAQASKKIAYQLQQIHKALGKDQKRVVVILMDDQNRKLSYLQERLSAHHSEHFAIHNKILLIDPVNNVFMYYPDSVNPMDILKDMKKVLEVSQIG